jgi:Pseudouridylate synthases, 23S RNA-specific
MCHIIIHRDNHPGLGEKPTRLEVKHLTCPLKPGDYLRVHHTPRRFPEVHRVDWSRKVNESNLEEPNPGVIVYENVDKGYLVVNKPSGVPVHPTVDNILENVVAAVGRALVSKQKNNHEWIYNISINVTDCKTSSSGIMDKEDISLPSRRKQQSDGNQKNRKKKKVDPLIYVATPQRLDHNTSGLFVVATRKEFAAYFAKLLRVKTEAHLRSGVVSNSNNNTSFGQTVDGNVQKRYRCLVCIQPGNRKNENGKW